MNIKTVIITHLKVYGFGGLYLPGECACAIDNLAPCNGIDLERCRSGFTAPLLTIEQSKEPHSDGMSVKGAGFRIQADRPAPEVEA